MDERAEDVNNNSILWSMCKKARSNGSVIGRAEVSGGWITMAPGILEDLLRSAEQLAAKDAEIERLKQDQESESFNTDHRFACREVALEARAKHAEAALAEMRERCAAEAEKDRAWNLDSLMPLYVGERIAAAIRALPLPNETAEEETLEELIAKLGPSKDPPPQSRDQACGGDEGDAAWQAYSTEREIVRGNTANYDRLERIFKAGYAAHRAPQPSAAVAMVERELARIQRSLDDPDDNPNRYGCEAAKVCLNRVLAVIRTLPSAQPAQEPSAWTTEYGSACTSDPKTAQLWRDAGVKLQPLYRGPKGAGLERQQPAAWQIFDGPADHKLVDTVSDPHAVDGYLASGDYVVRPLYTSLPDHTEAVRVLAEALQCYAETLQEPGMLTIKNRAAKALSHPAVLAAFCKYAPARAALAATAPETEGAS